MLREDLTQVLRLVAQGVFVPQIAAEFPLSEASAALALAHSRTVAGKVVLCPTRTPHKSRVHRHRRPHSRHRGMHTTPRRKTGTATMSIPISTAPGAIRPGDTDNRGRYAPPPPP
ncbi:zinc-binding dehydrogenase [Nocardia sp. NPDC004568]|uniref:zinc-binding dehydrogenase n=1 Tax=Nocardia sp. NPDC004568 TaxID=3154551 RepID=UPI0033B05030